MKKISLPFLMFVLLFFTNPVSSQENETALPLPRFASLRSNNVNARSGPGTRYPIEWIYMQSSAPVEIIAEFEFWRKIRDWQGSESWVHMSNLHGERTVKVITPGENNLYEKPDYNSDVVAKVEDEVVGKIISCPADSSFCEVKFGASEGWIAKSDVFGVKTNEDI